MKLCLLQNTDLLFPQCYTCYMVWGTHVDKAVWLRRRLTGGSASVCQVLRCREMMEIPWPPRMLEGVNDSCCVIRKKWTFSDKKSIVPKYSHCSYFYSIYLKYIYQLSVYYNIYLFLYKIIMNPSLTYMYMYCNIKILQDTGS